MTKTVTRKIGWNKGRPRVWLEKKVLLDAGFTHQAPWIFITENNCLTLKVDPEGTRKVAGSVDRPVIDILGRVVEECFDTEVVTVLKVVCTRQGTLKLTPYIEE